MKLTLILAAIILSAALLAVNETYREINAKLDDAIRLTKEAELVAKDAMPQQVLAWTERTK